MKSFISIIFIMTSLLCASSFGAKKENIRRQKLLKLINQELKTINAVKKKTSALKYRLFELMSEKVKVYKEIDNLRFIQAAKRQSREQAFSKTISYYNKTKEYGEKILKTRLPKRIKGAIYYTLALNSRDYAYDKKEHYYLQQAIKRSKGEENLNYLAKVSLAEYYYNTKKYRKATKLYKFIIKNNSDEWYTKNLYNYSWCLLKTKKFAKAINYLEESYLLSRKPDYINMQDQAITGLTNFYIYGKEIERGITFIENNSENKLADLLAFARKTANKSFTDETKLLLTKLNSKIDKTKNIELYKDLKVFELAFFEQIHMQSKFVATAELLSTLKLSKSQNEDVKIRVSNYVGQQQIILKKDASIHEKNYNGELLAKIISLFSSLSIIDKKNEAKYSFYISETFFSIGEKRLALKSYKKTLDLSKNHSEREDLRLKSIDALFNLIETTKLTKEEKSIELEYTFRKHLIFWPKSKKSQIIHPRLYALLLTSGRYDETQVALDKYQKAFPKDLEIQQNLFKDLLNQYISLKLPKKLSALTKKLRDGYLSFANPEILKAEKVLANILFQGFQELLTKGEFNKALVGNMKIYHDHNYPTAIKAEAAFNIAENHTRLNQHKDAFKWYGKSFNISTKKEKNERRKLLEKLSTRTALLQDHLYASKIDIFILKKFCSEKKKNQETFKKMIYNLAAKNYSRKLSYSFKKYSKCTAMINNELYVYILDHYYQTNNIKHFLSFISSYSLHKKYPSKLFVQYTDLYWKTKKYRKEMISNLKKIQSEEAKSFLQSISELKQFKKQIQSFKLNQVVITEKSTPASFSEELSARLTKLAPIISRGENLLNYQDSEITLIALSYLSSLTKDIAQEISIYKLPLKDSNFQKQFKEQMNILAKDFKLKQDNYQKVARNLINDSEVVSFNTKLFDHNLKDIAPHLNLRAPSSLYASTIDLHKE